MSERNIVVTVSILGAAVGGTLAYFALTERGRRTRDNLEGWLERAMREIGHLSRFARQVQQIAADSAREWERWQRAAAQLHQQPGTLQ